MNFAVHPSAKQPGVPGPWEGVAGHPVLSPRALCLVLVGELQQLFVTHHQQGVSLG